jgi:hypothetical protein
MKYKQMRLICIALLCIFFVQTGKAKCSIDPAKCWFTDLINKLEDPLVSDEFKKFMLQEDTDWDIYFVVYETYTATSVQELTNVNTLQIVKEHLAEHKDKTSKSLIAEIKEEGGYDTWKKKVINNAGGDLNEFSTSLSKWRFGKNNLTWDDYFINLKKKYPADYEKMIDDFVASSSLTKSEAYSIFSTTTVFYQKTLNRLIRKGKISTAKVQEAIKLLDRSLNKMPVVPSGTKYYRGIDLGGDDLISFIAKHKEGNKVKYKEYTYSANNRKNAFIDRVDKNVKITILTKDKSMGRTIHDVSFSKAFLNTSDEVIFMRNAEFEVKKIRRKKNNVFIIELIEK